MNTGKRQGPGLGGRYNVTERHRGIGGGKTLSKGQKGTVSTSHEQSIKHFTGSKRTEPQKSTTLTRMSKTPFYGVFTSQEV